MPDFGSTFGRAMLRAVTMTLLTGLVLGGGAMLVAGLRSPNANASRDADDRPAATAQADAPKPQDGAVRLDSEGQAKGGIETAAPAPAPYQDQIRVYGTVLALDRLTTLYNSSLTTAAQLRAAEVKLKASEIANDRAQNLLKVFPTAKAQAEAAEGAYELDKVGLQTAQADAEALRNTAIQDWGPVLGAAIIERSALAENLVRRKTCLIQVSLQPGTFVTPPPRIALTVAGRSVEGRYLAEATRADPRIQSIGYLYTAPMAPGLMPETSILASLPRGEATAGLSIPPSAIVWQAGKAWVYLRAGSDTFKRHALDEEAAPRADGGYVVPAASLPRDETLVIAGAQILLSQESRAQIPSDGDDQ